MPVRSVPLYGPARTVQGGPSLSGFADHTREAASIASIRIPA